MKGARYDRIRGDLAVAYMKIGAVLTRESDHPLVKTRGKERGFLLKLHEKNPDAPLSPFYLNLRTPDNPKKGPLTPEVVDLGAYCMLLLARRRKLEYDVVIPVPRAGDPYAESFGRQANVPCYFLDKDESGEKRRIVLRGGLPASIKRALLMDDLITEADSKGEAIEAVRDDATVHDLIVSVDREQGGGGHLKKWGCTLHANFTISELLDFYVLRGMMKRDLRTEIRTYLGLSG